MDTLETDSIQDHLPITKKKIKTQMSYFEPFSLASWKCTVVFFSMVFNLLSTWYKEVWKAFPVVLFLFKTVMNDSLPASTCTNKVTYFSGS